MRTRTLLRLSLQAIKSRGGGSPNEWWGTVDRGWVKLAWVGWGELGGQGVGNDIDCGEETLS